MQQHIDPILWQRHQAGGFDAVRAYRPRTGIDAFYVCILAYSEDQLENALAFATCAVQMESGARLYREALTYLSQVVQHRKQNVYLSPAGFEAYIRGGGNIPLYEQTSTFLKHIYREYTALRVLDIGVGDGTALLPALTENIVQLDLVEPSTAMLTRLEQYLATKGITYRAFNQTLQDFAKDRDDHWPLAQATFSLQTLPDMERPAGLRWLHEHCDRLLIAEFDVPAFAVSLAPDRVEYVVERFEIGLAEYPSSDLVAQEFMLPILFGYFDRSAARMNYEQPIQQWVFDLKAAGFGTIEAKRLFSYWWADAYLIDART